MKKLFVLFLFLTPAVFATDYVNQSVLLLDAGKQLTINNAGTGGAAFTTSFYMASGRRLKVWGSLINNPVRGSQTPCVDPCSISMQRNFGQQYFWYEEVDSAGSPLSPAKVSSAFILPQIPLACQSTWTLPIEVIGQDQYTTCVQLSITSPPSTNEYMEMRVNNHALQSPPNDQKMAVQINGGAWINVRNSNITSLDEAKWYATDGSHPIGDSTNTIRFMFPLPNSTLVSGTNTINFRFNGTDGVTSGYRVLDFNFLDLSKQYTLTQIAVTSNVATATTSATHALSNGTQVLIYEAPGQQARFNGLRTLTAVGSSTTFSFTPCGAISSGFFSISCTSPNGTYTTPVTTAGTTALSNYPSVASGVMYAVQALVPASAFTYDDPTTWVAPTGGSASNGQTLYKTGNLSNPAAPYPNYTLASKCNDCHTFEGKDLSYFHYSNWSIEQRAIFHGRSWQDAQDIAAYIRSLDAADAGPAIARPWNPVQQPCAGIDSAAVSAWDAGCGVDARLTYDNDIYEYIGGADWSPTGNGINFRTVPTTYELKDWDHWVPQYHPLDYVPNSNFYSSSMYTAYQACLSAINGGTTYAAYHATNNYCQYIYINEPALAAQYDPTASDGDYSKPGALFPSRFVLSSQYSLYQWTMVKMFEIQHPNFEGYADQMYTSVYGASTNGYYSRGWVMSRGLFNQAPHIQLTANHTPDREDPGLSNWRLITNSWYVAQMVNNCGNRRAEASQPADYPYLALFIDFQNPQARPVGYQLAETWAAANQCSADNTNTGTSYPPINMMFYSAQFFSADKRFQYMWMDSTHFTALVNQFATQMLALINAHTSAYWVSYLNNLPGGVGCTASGAGGAWTDSDPPLCNNMQFLLPMLNYWGANSTTVNAITTWANGLTGVTGWSGHNFTTDATSTCVVDNFADGTSWPICSNVHL